MRMDVETYKSQTARVQIDDLDLDAFRTQPLAPGALRCLRYMHDVEHHTVCYLRDLLVTSAHRDPTITSFLTFWNFEEFWHGEALAAVLAAHGEANSTLRIRGMRSDRRRIGCTRATPRNRPRGCATARCRGGLDETPLGRRIPPGAPAR